MIAATATATDLAELKARAARYAPGGAEAVWELRAHLSEKELRKLLAAFLPPAERDALE